ncbi:MAG: hypothetical protein M1321_03050 [Candidatus Marsarchaeota archaeon]|nr:hypothetical protein [Candidatus Marsarchaeota archaeon]
MDKAIDIVLGAVEGGVLAGYLALRAPLLVGALPAIALIHLVLRRRTAGHVSDWLATYARALSVRYAETGLMAHSVESTNARMDPRGFAEMHRRHMLGDSTDEHGAGGADGLRGIISFAMRTGRKVSASLEGFRKGIINEAETANLVRSKAGAMKSVTYAGLLFFLPLFGGISSNVMASLYPAAASAMPAFSLSILAYVALALLITSYAYDAASGIVERITGAMPLLSLSAAVLFIASNYISYAI